jgi:hypothetical protein
MACNNIDSQSLSRILSRHNVVQIINAPTRITPTTQTILDVLVCPNNLLPIEINNIRMDDISDHNFVYAKFNIKKSKPPALFKSYRDFSKFNFESFTADVLQIDWDYIYLCNTVDEMVYFFNQNIIQLYDTHAPMRKARITKPPAPWLTENLKLLMNLRNVAFRKYKRTGSEVDWREYKDRRNFVNACINAEKKAYLQQKFKLSPKAFWNTIKDFNIKTKNSDSVKFSIEELNSINKAFLDKPASLQPGDYNLIKNQYESHNFPRTDNKFTFEAVTVNKIEKVFYSIKSNAIGADHISLKMLINVFPFVSTHVTFIINKCLEAGEFPESWKDSLVIPLPKCVEPKSHGDYRPISVLPTMSKILERVVHEQLSQYVNDNNILPATQSGFRSSYSTSTALLHITDDIFNAVDQHKLTCLVLLDYSKAFDTIDHKILLLKMSYLGLSKSVVRFFQMYLGHRRQCAIAGNQRSDFRPVTRGVPQGSILGPLLFSLYTTDITAGIRYCKTHQYADDTQLYYSFYLSARLEAANNINYDLKQISANSNNHGLKLNEQKTTLLVIGRGRDTLLSDINFNIILNKHILKPQEYGKNLGLSIDSNLRFHEQVNKIIQNSFIKLKHLYKFKDILSSDVKLKLCDTLILSAIEYCGIVY